MNADFSTRHRTLRLRLVDVLLLALGIVALSWVLVASWSTAREAGRAREAVRQLRAQSRSEEQRLQALERVRRDRGSELAHGAFQTVAAPPARILADLEQTVPAGARLETLTLIYGGQAVQLDIGLLARTPESYDEFVARVEGSGRFNHLAFGAESRTAAMKVSLRARYDTGEGS